MARNSWQRLTLVLSASGLVLVLVNGVTVIQVPEAISDLLALVRVPTEEAQKESISVSNWPFGALYLGNYGLKPNQVESGGKDWLYELAHGAISGCVVKTHKPNEMWTLLSMFTSPSPPPSFLSSPMTSPSYVQIERRSDLGSLENAIFGNFEFAPFPADSFPMPSRICRPLYSVSEMDHWERYLSAFSALTLESFIPSPLAPRSTKPEFSVLLCHDYRGGYFKDSAWERSPPLPMTETSKENFSKNSSLPSAAGSAVTNHSATRSPLSSEEQTFAPSLPLGSQNQVSMTTFVPDAYTFTHWRYIDYFCYFSHARVTIPPVATIDAAHKNGVKVLGTFITEWDEGYIETIKLLEGKNGDKYYYARKLIEIAEKLKFDGWLINVEHSMKEAEVPILVAWMKEFKKLSNLKQQCVVWYDSITKKGELAWQSGLNSENEIFFDACDFFFTDYHWKLGNLEVSMTYAKEKAEKVFYGVDVWGRGTYGGGGWNTPVALKAICNTKLSPNPPAEPLANDDKSKFQKNEPNLPSGALPLSPASKLSSKNSTSYQKSENETNTSTSIQRSSEGEEKEKKFSIAIFAPGWTLESQVDSFDSLYRNESKFWEGAEQLNLFSEKFEKHLSEYYRIYLADRKPGEDFGPDDILSPLERSEDGAYGKAQEQARALTLVQSTEIAGRFKSLPQLFNPRTGGSQWTWRHIRFDLIKKETEQISSSGLSPGSTPDESKGEPSSSIPITEEYLDSQPEITFSLWVKGNGPNSSDPWRVRVLLLNAENRMIQQFDTGRREATAEWQQMTYKWNNYGIGVRSILWLDGSRDAESWAGFYGPTFDRPSVLIANPSSIDAVATYVSERKLENSQLPFVSAFETGQGTALFTAGEPLNTGLLDGAHWYNLAAQTNFPNLKIVQRSFLSNASSRTLSSSTRSTTSVVTEKNEETSADASGTQQNSILKRVAARIVDASAIDGGVWHGSSCLKLDATVILAPEQNQNLQSSDFISAQSTSSGMPPSSPLLTSSHTRVLSYPDSITGQATPQSPRNVSSPSIPPLSLSGSSLSRRRKSSKRLMLDTLKVAVPTSEATVSLFPLGIDFPAGTGFNLNIIFRSLQIPINATVSAIIARKKKFTGARLTPLFWDLMDKNLRDPNAVSSIGWIHFQSHWESEADTIYDGVDLRITATQHPKTSGINTSSSSVSSSPRSPRLALASHSSLSPVIIPPAPAPTTADLSLLIGFLKIDLSSRPPPLPPASEAISSAEASPLELKYKLTWSAQSLFTDAPYFDLTTFWKPAPVPGHLAHLGAPHYLITATTTTKDNAETGSMEIPTILCQGRTWNNSWVISGIPSTKDISFAVTTVFPDYTTPSNLYDRVSISWPSE